MKLTYPKSSLRIKSPTTGKLLCIRGFNFGNKIIESTLHVGRWSNDFIEYQPVLEHKSHANGNLYDEMIVNIPPGKIIKQLNTVVEQHRIGTQQSFDRVRNVLDDVDADVTYGLRNKQADGISTLLLQQKQSESFKKSFFFRSIFNKLCISNITFKFTTK